MSDEEIRELNVDIYQTEYTSRRNFLRYPADWIIRFHNKYMIDNIPTGRILDYGCGSGNNSVFFIKNGYDLTGVDVADAVLQLIKENLKENHLDPKLIEKFSIISPEDLSLPFEDNYFDFILSNQVLYYLASEKQIKRVCKELSRCLKPGGVVFFTVMGPKNYYITEHTKKVDGKIHEIVIDDPDHRLYPLHEKIYLVEDAEELKDLFGMFDCITTGYFDQSMLEMSSNFHWIFAGKKGAE